MAEHPMQADGELLAEFVARRSEPAFTALIQRHGTMVHGVALRVLADHHEAQDVAQAVFVALARKAAQLRRQPSVGGWLHRVAWCLAQDVRCSRQSRQQREQRAMRDQPLADTASPDAGLFRAELDAALNQLPERYRQPLVLFHLEGQSLDEVGAALGLNPNTLRTRLVRARELLRKKLVRRGVTVGSVGALTALLSAESGAATLPATFVASTVSAATGGSLTAAVATLTTKGITIMAMTKLKLGAVAAATALLLIGGGMLWVRESSAPPSVPPPETTTIAPPKTVAAAAPAVVTAAPPAVSTRRGLILRQANPPMEVTDSRGRRYVARNVTKLDGAVWRHYSFGMEPYLCQALRVTEAEQIQMQQMLDTVWQGADALATCFAVTPTNDALLVTWKGETFRDVYRAQREAARNQVLMGAQGILGAERAEVVGWLPQAGNIGWPDVLPDPARVSSDYRLTVSVTNANDVIAMRYDARFGDGRIVSGSNPGLGPWPGLGEQLGVPRQTVLNNLAARRQKPTMGLIQYRDPAEPVDDAPIAAEDTATGQRYLYQPAPSR